MIYSSNFFQCRKSVVKACFHNLVGMQRREHPILFGVGLPRSGTKTIGCSFSGGVRSAHEAKPAMTINLILAYLHGKYAKWEVVQLLRFRQSRLLLDIESAHYLHYIIPELRAAFPRVRFLLTVREPLGWVKSEILKNSYTKYSHWLLLQNYRYGLSRKQDIEPFLREIPHAYPLDSYLLYWRNHINRVLKYTSSDELLVVSTHELGKKVDLILEFIGASPASCEIKRVWENKGAEFPYVFDEEYAKQRIRELLLNFIEEKLPVLFRWMPYV